MLSNLVLAKHRSMGSLSLYMSMHVSLQVQAKWCLCVLLQRKMLTYSNSQSSFMVKSKSLIGA